MFKYDYLVCEVKRLLLFWFFHDDFVHRIDRMNTPHSNQKHQLILVSSLSSVSVVFQNGKKVERKKIMNNRTTNKNNDEKMNDNGTDGKNCILNENPK